MTARVVDASIVTKWFISEEHTEEARLLPASPDRRLIAPDIMGVEIARVILKKVRRGQLLESEARMPIVAALSQIVELHPTLPLLARAVDIAIRHQRDPYDAVYVALALQERCTLVTADRVLYGALARVYPETMVWVGDLPRILLGPA